MSDLFPMSSMHQIIWQTTKYIQAEDPLLTRQRIQRADALIVCHKI